MDRSSKNSDRELAINELQNREQMAIKASMIGMIVNGALSFSKSS